MSLVLCWDRTRTSLVRRRRPTSWSFFNLYRNTRYPGSLLVTSPPDKSRENFLLTKTASFQRFSSSHIGLPTDAT